MFEQVLPGNTKTILAILEKSAIIQKAYLAGGTALALQLGHRVSYDLDFFTFEEFDEAELLPEIAKISEFKLEKISWRTILGKFSGVKFSIFYYKYPILFPAEKFGMVNLAAVLDIAAMKIAAIASRGARRDFVDLYFICKEGASLEDIFESYDKKYKNLAAMRAHILKSLVYFDDALADGMPLMLKPVDWKTVMRYFEDEARKMSR